MKTVYDKIAHKKISISELVTMERKILEAIDFAATTTTFYELAMNRLVKYLVTQGKYSEHLAIEIEQVCSCLSKFICYNYDLVCLYDKSTLANAVFNFVLSIFELNGSPTKSVSPLEEQCKNAILDSIGSFRRKFKGLNNLAKFTSKPTL